MVHDSDRHKNPSFLDVIIGKPSFSDVSCSSFPHENNTYLPIVLSPNAGNNNTNNNSNSNNKNEHFPVRQPISQ